VQDEIARYGPFALAVFVVSLLVAKYPGHLGLSSERVRSSLLMYNAAFVLFVALDLISGRALTSMTDLPRAAAVLLFAIAVLGIANVLYLLVRRRAPR
jgi:K+-transporting ATPase A subunit